MGLNEIKQKKKKPFFSITFSYPLKPPTSTIQTQKNRHHYSATFSAINAISDLR